MAIPAMTSAGLLPAGVHECTLDEAESGFCWNNHRQGLWRNFVSLLDQFRALGFDVALVIDGSFVTDKALPGDIELALDIHGVQPPLAGQILMYFWSHHQRIHATMGIDFYPSQPGESDFLSFFQYAGEKTAAMKNIDSKTLKGILRVESW